MKKKLREQLIMLAKQILQEEKSFNTSSIKKLVIAIHEKLTVLEYLENQLDGINDSKIEESLDSKSFREENWFTEPEPVPQPTHKEDIIEPLMEKIKDIVAQMPQESERIDEILNEMLPKENEPEPPVNKIEKPKYIQNDLEDFAANYQVTPEFERKKPESTSEISVTPESLDEKPISKNQPEFRQRSLNDTANRGLNIGLNDRLAFIRHLFEGQTEDYTRVLSQINTMENFEEAQNFIKEKVKPDYNHWINKEEYSGRFIAIVEKSFNY